MFNLLKSNIGLALISLAVTIPLIIYLLPPIQKYKVDLINKDKRELYQIWYHDFDGNGVSERVKLIWHTENKTHVSVDELDGKSINQWNFDGNYLKENGFVYGDYDNNGQDEVFVATYHEDSVFLNWFEPYNGHLRQYSVFITTVDFDGDFPECTINPCTLEDINGDGFKEYFFVLNTAYTSQPRKFYVYDLKNDSLYESPLSGAGILDPLVFDLNKDGRSEILMESRAFGNFAFDYPYTDSISWLMVFNDHAEYLFEPKEVGIHPSYVQTVPFISNDTTYLAVLYCYLGTKNDASRLQLYDTRGLFIRDIVLDTNKIKDALLLSLDPVRRNRLFIVYLNGDIEEYDKNLKQIEFKNLKEIEGSSRTFPNPVVDLDQDNKFELLFKGRNNESIIILRHDFSHPVIMEFNSDVAMGFTLIQRGNKRPLLFVQGNDYGYVLDYHVQSLYYFKYPIYLLIFGFLFLILFLIREYGVKIRYEKESKIAELQLKSIQQQTDSHFTFNIINSIGSLFEKKDTEKANYIFGKYAKILRSSVISSDKIAISLTQELEDVENYLILEKFRLDDRFDYSIKISEEIDLQFLIPKMLVHTFVENAIKHGIRHLKEEGIIRISVAKNSHHCEITIEDNGIGRENAANLSKESTGQGLRIMDEILQLYLSLKKNKISYKIKDLSDGSGESSGTRVNISIPLK